MMISTDLKKAIAVLNNDDIIGFPTETVYGLAGNIFSETAIKKIYQLKKRPLFNPLIVHIKSIEGLDNIARDIPTSAQKLAKTFWPGPLTLLLKKKEIIPDYITSGNKTVAVRIPNHAVALALLQQLEFPLAAPSANPYTRISPTSAKHVEDYFGKQLKVILDGGHCKSGVESTIIGFDGEQPIVYRYGAISQEDIEAVVGKVKIINKNEKKPEAPGMALKHYAPRSLLHLTDHILDDLKLFPNKKIGFLLFNKALASVNEDHQIVLSASADLKEATKNLYAALHKLDSKGFDVIIAERFPNNNLGKTINDRLERAMVKV
ncbi:threonylcarbamoyl-AMP synthase [Pedobacter sp. SD-b]|uniref:Threonylcarbamoyl-AMP synthase n=1 Tax=Pedobacter segetis TaxID=2793069 RepID=A0ABS1BIP5_9SPHI|nr:L-threonylcarbamoyladenylate synthase [Pedobacter segetis]MBK0382760.1 threonylcarbamoyl-AMP synthase [Pedobacter segetis]